MAQIQLPREEQLVAYFVLKCAGQRPLGRTQLMKLLYLADYEARRYLGRPISDLEYVWHNFGPYDDRLMSAIGTLRDGNVVLEETVLYPTGKEGYKYSPGLETDVSYSFSPLELEILGYVCTTYSDLNLQALLADVVYETEPMQQVQAHGARGDLLDMEMLNGQKSHAYGISFEELYARIQAARAGEYDLHTEVMRSMRERHGIA